MLEDAAPMPGVEDYIHAAERARNPCGSRIRFQAIMGRRQTRSVRTRTSHFETIVCRDDVGRAKPDPAAYLAAVSRILSVSGRPIAFALEDSPPGVKAAKRCRTLLRRSARADDQKSVISRSRHALGVPRRYAFARNSWKTCLNSLTAVD